jgi:hypothetical protein
LLPDGEYPQDIILKKMDPKVAALPGAGPQEIVPQTTHPQVIDPHGADPQISASTRWILKRPLFLEQALKRSSLKRHILK